MSMAAAYRRVGWVLITCLGAALGPGCDDERLVDVSRVPASIRKPQADCRLDGVLDASRRSPADCRVGVSSSRREQLH